MHFVLAFGVVSVYMLLYLLPFCGMVFDFALLPFCRFVEIGEKNADASTGPIICSNDVQNVSEICRRKPQKICRAGIQKTPKKSACNPVKQNLDRFLTDFLRESAAGF